MDNRTLFLILVVAASIGACEGSGEPRDLGRKSLGLSEKSPNPVPVQQVNVPDQFVRAKWENVGHGEASVHASVLRLSLENISKFKLDATAVLRCSGLMEYTADATIGSATLEPGEAKTFVVTPNDFPIQTSEGAAQARLDIRMMVYTDSGPSETRMLTNGFYYRHHDGYSKIETFRQKYLFKKGQGRLSGFEDDVPKGRELGRLKKSDGGFKTVTENDFAVIRDGKIVGYKMGSSIGVGFLFEDGDESVEADGPEEGNDPGEVL